MKTYKLNKILSSLLLAGLVVPLAAQAAETTENSAEQAEVIQVTGFRSSLNAALMSKRDAVGTSDLILAEDIGKFPDLNIADSLGRIPGVSVEQDGGEGRQISIRGLGSRYVKTTINGMESASAGGGSDAGGGSNTSRAFDFNIFASELFTQIKVDKTPAAELEDGGIGGTVDLQAARPFQYQGTKLSYNLNARYNDISGETKPRVSFMASKNFDNKFGVLASVAYSEGLVQTEGASTVHWTRLNPNYVADGDLVTEGGSNYVIDENNTIITPNAGYTNDDLDGAWLPRIPRYSVYSKDQSRLGITGALQYAPTEDLVFNLDFLHAQLDTLVNERQYEILFRDNKDNPTYAENLIKDDEGRIVAGAFSSAPVRSEARQDKIESEFNQLSLNANWYINDKLNVQFLIGKGTSDTDVPYKTTLGLDAESMVAFSFDKNHAPLDLINGQTGVVGSGEINRDMMSFAFAPGVGRKLDGTAYTAQELSQLMTNGGQYTVGLARTEADTIESENSTIKIDADYILNDSLTLKFGVNSRSFETERHNWRNSWQEEVSGCIDYDDDKARFRNAEELMKCDPNAILDGTAFASTISEQGLEFGNAAGVPSDSLLTQNTWLAPDFKKMLGEYGDKYYFQPRERLNNGYIIKEEVDAAYAQLSFNTELAGLGVRGNLGVRYLENTNYAWSVKVGTYDSKTLLLNDPNAGIEWVEAKSTSEDFLPSLNLAVDVLDDVVVRFSASKAITRPKLSDLASNISVSYGDDGEGGDSSQAVGRIRLGAGPTLKPEEATQYEFGAEWYFAPEALLAGTFFYKDIATLSKKSNEQTVSAEYLASIGGDVERWTPEKLWSIEQLVNNEPEGMWGAEFTYQQPFTDLPYPLSQMGISANYTYIDFTVEHEDPFTGRMLKVEPEGTSQTTFNTTLYYEEGDWSGRISYSERADYIKDFNVRKREGNFGRGQIGNGSLKFSGRYKLNKYLSLSFEAINITNESRKQWSSVEFQNPYEYFANGRQYLLGIRGSI
ncbi:TonB-dependent receptor [Catenovulum sp. 2E275]|uniref:TonB-dependent receptor n=1 Tax=Catenovulum sp. 2E275 TaxID=2980497 RepID=UPI0021D13F83|nr:TonB-dependent receptor [Catenovulum sp. 2E275]MCU4675310.1 TonB-dependent receptor [Catenovulum sp. 2E275]